MYGGFNYFIGVEQTPIEATTSETFLSSPIKRTAYNSQETFGKNDLREILLNQIKDNILDNFVEFHYTPQKEDGIQELINKGLL